MKSRKPIEILDEALLKVKHVDSNESKLDVLEDALCSKGVSKVLATNDNLKKSFKEEYAKSSSALAEEISNLSRHIFSQLDHLEMTGSVASGDLITSKIPLSHTLSSSYYNAVVEHVSQQILSTEEQDKRTMILERWHNV